MLKQINISGSGIVSAVSDSKNKKIPVIFVYDKDKTGCILRLGYYLEYEELDQRKIRWFHPNEYKIAYKSLSQNEAANPVMSVDFFDPQKNHEKKFLIDIPLEDMGSILIRLIFRILPSGDRTFVLQTEHKKGNKHDIIVRYDCAHGFIHKDVYKGGKQVEKVTLDIQDYKMAISTGIKEIKNGLNTRVAVGLVHHPDIIKAFDDAEKKILGLIDDNIGIHKDVKSNLTVVGNEIILV